MIEFTHHKELLDQLTTPVYVKSADHKWVYVNQAFCNLFNQSRECLLGKTDYDVTPKEQSDVFWEKDNLVLETRQTNINIEQTTDGDGNIIWVESRKSYFENEAGEKFIFGVLSDISKLKVREVELDEARKKAEAADISKSQFLANMSHEIRTPMNGVMGMAELLSATELTPKQQNFADIIVKSGKVLLTVINDILDFSKIDAGEMEIHNKPFNLADAIEDVAMLMSSLAAEKSIELAVRIDPELPILLVGDAARVRQVMSNLLSNAIKFTSEGHVLVDIAGEIRGEDDQQFVQLVMRVEDTGLGIPESKQAAIFEKFTQVDNSARRTHEGTGLGLSICKSLIELMGGTIMLESKLGQGSVFTIDLTLPVQDKEKFCRPVRTNVSGAHVLVIDDNAVNREILLEQCKAWSFEPKAVPSGEEGIALLKAAAQLDKPFDVIILDYQMPHMGGIDTAKIIRQDSDVKATPIVMLTSVDNSDVTSAVTELNIQGHLAKPAKSSLLLETIVDAISQGKAQNMSTWHEREQSNTPVNTSCDTEKQIPSDTRTVDILIAEDNAVNITVYEQILDRLDYEFEIAKNGREAVAFYQALQPQLMIMDVSMPEMNGLEATKAIRKIDAQQGTHVHIIGATAHAMSGDMEKCLDAGMDDYLSKPISPKRLIEKIEAWMQADSGKKAGKNSCA